MSKPSDDIRVAEGRDYVDPFDNVIDAAVTGEGLIAIETPSQWAALTEAMDAVVAIQDELEAADPPPDWPDGVEPDEQGVWCNCPVQCQGTIDGLPFYFRARGEHWTLDIAATPDGDAVGVGMPLDGEWARYKAGEITAEEMQREPGWTHEEEWPGGAYAAGWMTVADAVRCITKAVGIYRAAR